MLQKKFNFLIIIVILLFLFVILTSVYYFFFTTGGSSLITKLALYKYAEPRDVDIEKIDGSLSQTLTYQNIKIKDLKRFPEGSILEIQKLEVYFTSFDFGGLNAKISNGKLRLPQSEAILFYGSYLNNSFDFNVYSKYVNAGELIDLFLESKVLKNLSGIISNIDIYVKGSFIEPILNGKFHIDKLSFNDLLITNCSGSFTISLKDIKDKIKLYGEVNFIDGVVLAKHTNIKVQQGKVSFSGNSKSPIVSFKGSSTVEGVKINITLNGSPGMYDLSLASEPPMPQERLLAMLATGKAWKGAEGSLGKAQISPDLAKDFIDYFIFSASGSNFAERLGMTDISLKYDKQTKGIGFKKSISDKVEVDYAVEQSRTKEDNPPTTHKVGGEYKISESTSIGVEAQKEIRQDEETTQIKDDSQANDKVLLKFKRKF